MTLTYRINLKSLLQAVQIRLLLHETQSMGRLLSAFLIVLLSACLGSRSFGKSNSDSMFFRQVRQILCLSLSQIETTPAI
jgi:hypothetical protein